MTFLQQLFVAIRDEQTLFGMEVQIQILVYNCANEERGWGGGGFLPFFWYRFVYDFLL